MTWEELISELRRLNRTEKLQAMQVLVQELASEEDALLIHGTQYEVWSPYDSAGAASTLLQMLEKDQEANND